MGHHMEKMPVTALVAGDTVKMEGSRTSLQAVTSSQFIQGNFLSGVIHIFKVLSSSMYQMMVSNRQYSNKKSYSRCQKETSSWKLSLLYSKCCR